MKSRYQPVTAPREILIQYAGVTPEQWSSLNPWEKLRHEREWRETSQGREFQARADEEQAEREQRMREWRSTPNEPA